MRATPPALVLALLLATGLDARPITVVARDLELRDVFQMVARAGGLNVVLGPEVAGRTAVELRGVEPEEALRLLAGVHGLSLGRSGGVYVVGTRAAVGAVVTTPEVRVFPIRSRPAEAVVAIVKAHYPDCLVTVDPWTNSVIVTTGVPATKAPPRTWTPPSLPEPGPTE